jgi:predicted esterase
MLRVHLRLPGARAKVCLLLGIVLFLLGRTARAEPLGLEGVVVYPARAPGVHSITVVLHGMCGHPENACRHFEDQVTAREHLVCPRATQACPGGGFIWPQRGYAEAIESSVQRALAALGARADEQHGRTLIGYSLGAFRALELAEHGAGRYPRVMLIGAKILPSVKRLNDAGVTRLLLSAGRADMMHGHMQREARRLLRGGYAARFLELGGAGHFFTPGFQDYLPEALDWLAFEAVPNG